MAHIVFRANYLKQVLQKHFIVRPLLAS